MRTQLLAVVAVLAAGVLGVLGDPVPAAADVPPPADAHAHWAAGNQIPAAPHDDVVKRAWAKGCAHRYTMTCLKLDVVSFVDRLSDTEELQVLPGVTVVRENASATGGAASGEARGRAHAALLAALAKDYPRDADARVDAYLARRLGLFLDTHALNVRLLDAASAAAAAARSLGDDWDLAASAAGAGAADSQGTGRGKDKKGYGQLLAMGMMMKGMMGAMAMAGVAAIAGKALIVGLMALTLAAIAGLKSLAGGGGGKAVTYEIVSKPVYSHEHSHSHEVQHGHGGGGGGGYGHSSYGRSFDEAVATAAAAGADPAALQGGRAARAMGDAHDLAYGAYLQAPQRPTAHPAP